jgi:UDP-glucose:(heptosyl)LPS alpha-1,3-glucosyltransferase
MKIAFLIWDYSPSRGGQERYLSRLIGELTGRGHEIHVFATRCEGAAAAGVTFHRVPAVDWGPCLRTISYLRTTRRMLATERFDIVSGLTRFYPLDVYRMGSGLHKVWLMRKAEEAAGHLIPYTRPFTWLALFMEGKMFNPAYCRHIIANSRLCAEQLQALYGYPPDRITVIYNGVDHDSFHPGLRHQHREEVLRRLGIPAGAPVALFVSNNLKRKGLETVLRSLVRTQGERPALLVVGGGSQGRWLSLAQNLRIADQVRFLGRVPDVRPYYGAADFLALPTRYDPFANVCLEAMACGLPVITTRDNGAAEIIEDGGDGFILDRPDNVTSLARKMSALADGEMRARMASAAREKSLGYTIGRNADETLAVYRRVMEERSDRAL